MTILFRSDAGPIEFFEQASFRVALNDDGVGQLVAPPEVINGLVGPVTCSVDGVDVFRWEVEDRTRLVGDREQVTVSGRGITAALERAIVLPAGYPNYTERTRSPIGAPLGIWLDLFAEAQARGRVLGITPTWTVTTDSNGAPWTETVKAQLDPGVNLRDLLREMTEVEGAEWLPRFGGMIDAAPSVGVDRSAEVVLFFGADQMELNKTSSTRNRRQTVYLEASTGVSEVTNGAGADAGEIWLEGQDFADPLTRPIVAGKLAAQLEAGEEEVTVVVQPDVGAFTRFQVGDLIGVDTGGTAPEIARVVGIMIAVDETGVQVELTLFSEVQLRQQKLDDAIQAKADVKLAASTTLQRRHGLVTADRFLSGAVGTDVAISSENFVPAVPGPGNGWAIFGNGNAEFNDAIFRGDLQSDNYVTGVSGWKLDRTGDAELNDALIRGDLQSVNYVPGVSGWKLDKNGNVEFDQGQFRGVVTTTGDIIIPPGAPAPGLGSIRAESVVDAGRTIYKIGLGAYPQTSFFEAGSIFADPTDTVVVGGQRRVGNTALVGLGLAQQQGAAFLVGVRNYTEAIGPWRFVPDSVRGGTSGVQLISAPFTSDAASPLTISTTSTTGTVLTVNGRAVFNERVTINNETRTQALVGTPDNTHSISNYRDISARRDLAAGRDLFASRNTILSQNLTVFGTSLFDGNADFNGNVGFRISQSGRFFTMNEAGIGSQGREPTLDTSGDVFGFVGIAGTLQGGTVRRMFRVCSGAFLQTSDETKKGEVETVDPTYCYDSVRSLRLTRYALSKERDLYYTQKGEWMLGDREDFDDPGGPEKVLGIMAQEAPAEVADGTRLNVDLYSYTSLVLGAVQALQEKVEALEAARG